MSDFIHLETRFLEINENEHLSNAFTREHYPLNSIPTNCILDKTLPGLGATYSEIFAERCSIIIEPNIPVIQGKVSAHKELLGVYEGCNKNTIKTYLQNKTIKHKKILCTPEGYVKVRNIALDIEIDLYKEYFCLYDECEKITQDIDYRDTISLPMNDFFSFENKAFVSATPLKMRNPEFKKQGFFRLEVKPTYEYRKELKLITTNSYERSIIKQMNELKDSECICVFMNSTNGINKLVNLLESQEIEDYKVFCSRKSEIKFKEKEIQKSHESLNFPLAKYNFFTSRFFSAVDIYTEKQPDIIIITDLMEAKHSMIDPFTNAIQIYGRFRNTFIDGGKFKSLTHISNYGNVGSVFSESDIENYINTSKETYEQLKLNITNADNEGSRKSLEDSLNGCAYNKFINEDGSLNYFKVDNFYDDERIRGYYQAPNSLHAAYEETNHIIPTHSDIIYFVSDEEKLKYKRQKSTTEQRKILIKKLNALSHSIEITPEEFERAKADYLSIGNREMQKETKYTIDAYERLGSENIIAVNFYKDRIDNLLKKKKKETNQKDMFSKKVCDAILNRFPQNNTYKKDELIDGFYEIFRNYGIDAKVNLNTIRKYYGADELKGKKVGFIKLHLFQPDNEFN